MQAAVRAFALGAQAAGIRRMWWVSPDFDGWPLDEPPLLDALTAWAKQPGVHLTWISHDFEHVRRAFPRLTRWRQTFAHVVTCRAPTDLPMSDVPTLLLADAKAAMRMVDLEHVRGWLRNDASDVCRVREQIDAILQRSTDTFAAVTLGL
jgi:hypothetical protein